MRTQHVIPVHHVNKQGEPIDLDLTVTWDGENPDMTLQIGRGSTVILTPASVEQLRSVL